MSERAALGRELTLLVPEELLQALAELVAVRVRELPATPEPSSWLDFEGAREYLRFSRDQLYKLTAARAIPFRKKRGGQGLLFHRAEFDRWLEAAYEPTGCSAGRRRGYAPGPGNGGDAPMQTKANPRAASNRSGRTSPTTAAPGSNDKTSGHAPTRNAAGRECECVGAGERGAGGEAEPRNGVGDRAQPQAER